MFENKNFSFPDRYVGKRMSPEAAEGLSRPSANEKTSRSRLETRGFLDFDELIEALDLDDAESLEAISRKTMSSRGFLDTEKMKAAIDLDNPDNLFGREESVSRLTVKLDTAARNLSTNSVARNKSGLLPELTSAGSKASSKLAALPDNLVQVKGLGDEGLNIARLSTPSFCTVVIILTFAIAHFLFSSL